MRGRPRKTWSDCVEADMNICNLGGIDPQNRAARRLGIRRTSRLLSTLATWIPTTDEILDQLQAKTSIRTTILDGNGVS